MSATARIALTAVAPISWGTTYIVTSEWLPPDRPLLSGLLRALPAGLLAIAIGRRLPHGSWWWRAAVLGVLNIGAFFALLFWRRTASPEESRQHSGRLVHWPPRASRWRCWVSGRLAGASAGRWWASSESRSWC